MTVGIDFADGTLLLSDLGEAAALLDGLVVWDQRVGRHRASAYRYAAILRALHGRADYEDRAKGYAELALHEAAPRPMRAYQTAALAAWQAAQRRGVVVLPTGAGKSYVALRAILACQRSALVIAPTIDLVQQWAGDLAERLGTEVGQYGGGEKTMRPVTVATYDSAVLFMPWHGHRFGLLVCDECHHLPAAATSSVATACLAPFRLGLTATPERADGGHERLTDLLGPIVHRTAISELEGNFLASYQAEIVETTLDPDEAIAYADARQEYLAFTRSVGVDFSKPDGWQQFLSAAARDSRGRAAMRAYRTQRAISRASRAKLRACWDLLRDHGGERSIIFTDDNDTAYTLGRLFCIPVLTHRTRPAERKAMLTNFRSGRWPVLATSKVLNEGVDVPEASVGIIVSGSGSVREHVQRLGRILRPQAGKTAMLYEIVSAGTGEGYTSERRRSHVAFGEEA
jgi:superfamily II DNA or RNA helicase